MYDQLEERAEVLEDRRDWTASVAAGAAVVAVLTGLCAAFIALAPSV